MKRIQLFYNNGIKAVLLLIILSVLSTTAITGCGKTDTYRGEVVKTETAFLNQLKTPDDRVIALAEDIVLTEPVVISGNKEITGDGSLTYSKEGAKTAYMITVSEGASFIVGEQVTIDTAGITGGIHVEAGGALTLQDSAVVKNAQAGVANVLVEGAFTMKGGYLKDAKGNNIINKNEMNVSGGEIVGSGSKYAAIYNEGTLTQEGGTISGAYNNVVNVWQSKFEWKAGTNQNSIRDGVFVAEGAELKVTSKDAVLINAGARGIYSNGAVVIDDISLKECGDTLLKIGKNGELTLNAGTLAQGNYHGVDNAGTMYMAGGNITMNKNCGIVNTGTLTVIGGTISSNENKGILNKHAGAAELISKSVTLSSNNIAIANEDKGAFELANAKIMMSSTTNVYVYDGEMNIHDIALNASGSNNVRVIAGDLILNNVEVKGNSKSSSRSQHGILVDGGSVVAENVIVSGTTGDGIRNKGGKVTGKNIVMDAIGQRSVSNAAQDGTGLGGTIVIDKLEVKSTLYMNILSEVDGKIIINDAVLAQSPSNNVRVNEGYLELNNVQILGHNPESASNVHGVYMEGGELVANNVTIKDTTGNGIRNKNGIFRGTNIEIYNVKGDSAIYNLPLTETENNGKILIDGLVIKNSQSKNLTTSAGETVIKNAVLGATGGNNIKMEDGVVNLYDVELEGQREDATAYTHGIMVEGGTLYAENLNVHNTNTSAIRSKAGITVVKNMTVTDVGGAGISVAATNESVSGYVLIDKITVNGTGGNNILVEGGIAEIKHAVLYPSKSNNIKVTKGQLILKDAEVQGNLPTSAASNHGIYLEGGTLTAKDITVYGTTGNAIRNKGANVKITDIVISQIPDIGITSAKNDDGVAGTMTIDRIVMKESGNYNVIVDAGTVSLKNAEFGKSKSNNLRCNGGTLSLEDAVILGNNSTSGGHHGIYINGGAVIANDLTVENTSGSAIRMSKGSFNGKELVARGIGVNVVNANGGSAIIDTLTSENVADANIVLAEGANVTILNATLCKTEDAHNIKLYTDSLLTMNDVVVNGTGSADRYGILAEGGSAKLQNVTLDGALRAAIRINRDNSTVTGVDVRIINTNMGVSAYAGTVSFNKLTLKNVNGNGIVAEGENAKVIITDSVFGATAGHSVKTTAGKITLEGVEIKGVTADDKYGIIAEGGNVELKDVSIKNVPKAAIRINTKGGSIKGSGVYIQSEEYGISAQGGKVDLTDVTFDVNYTNVYADGADVVISDAVLNKTKADSVVINAGTLSLSDCEIKGSSFGYGIYLADGLLKADNTLSIKDTCLQGIMVEGGEIKAIGENVAVSIDTTGKSTSDNDRKEGLFNKGGKVSIDNLTIKNTSGVGVVNSSGGTMILNNLNISGVGKWYNVKNESAGSTLTIDGATLGKTPSNNVYASNGSVTLKNATILGTESNSTHGILATGGDFVLENVTIKASANAGIRINKEASEVKGTNIVIVGSKEGISNTSGSLVLKNLEVSEVESYGIYNNGSLKLAGEIKAWIYMDKNVTIKATESLSGKMELDWADGKLPSDMVAVQFKSTEDLKASKGTISYVGNTGASYRPYYYGTQILLNDKSNMEFIVENYDELTEALTEIEKENLTTATIVIAGDIAVSAEIVINDGRDITIEDDGTERKIYRAAGYNGQLISVSENATLTLNSSSLDNTAPTLIVDGGSKDNIVNDGACSLIANNGVLTVEKGVKLQNNEGSGAFAGLGIYVSGNTTFKGVMTNIVGTNSGTNGSGIAVDGALLTLEDALIEGNSSNGWGVIVAINEGDIDATNTIFKDNEANGAGAILVKSATGSEASFEDCTFTGNIARAGSGGAFGTDCTTEDSVSFKNCTFTNNEASGEGGAINMAGGTWVSLENCEFIGNVTEQVNAKYSNCGFGDIRLGDNNSKGGAIKLSGKIVADIYLNQAGKITVTGALTEGSNVIANWRLKTSSGSAIINGNSFDGITFASEEVMDASKEYFSLSSNYSDDYVLKFEGTTGTLWKQYKVTNEDELKDAIASINSASVKTGYIIIADSFTISANVAIPAGCNVNITDDGTARTIKRDKDSGYLGDVFYVASTATLNVVSTSNDNASPTLIIDGGRTDGVVCNGDASLIRNAGTLTVEKGVALQNSENAANKRGFGIYVSGTTTFKGVMKNIVGTHSSANGTSIVVNGNALTLEGAIIENNSTAGSGVIQVVSGGSLTATDTIFRNNTANGYGGAINLNSDTGNKMVIDGCTFDANKATTGYGGAITQDSKTEDSVIIKNTTFTNNTAGGEGGAINMSGGSWITLENCEFSGNVTEQVNAGYSNCGFGDIRLGDNRTGGIKISGKMIIDIYMNQAGPIKVTGALTEGSNVVANWRLGKISGNSFDGITFASEAVMEASKDYISLSTNYSDDYKLKFEGTKGILWLKTAVTNETELQEALTKIEGTNDKTGYIIIAGDFTISANVEIPAGCNVTITDDGTARTIKRASGYLDGIFNVASGATLNVVSTSGDNASPTLIIDGGSEDGIVCTGGASLIGNAGTLTVEKGVALQNNESSGNNRGLGIYVSGTTTFKGVMKNIVGTYSGTNGSAIVVNGNSLTLDGAIIENCSTAGNGVVQVINAATLNATDTIFRNNTANGSGALKIDTNASMKVKIDNCTFDGNKSTGGNGGAVEVTSTTANAVVIKNSAFTNNEAQGEGGAINIPTGGWLALENCTFSGNVAKQVNESLSNCGFGDIRVANNTSAGGLYISGKMVVDIYLNQAGKIHVTGALTEGSNVVANWRLGKITGDTFDGITFASEAVMEASKDYISLSENYNSTYLLKCEGTVGTLWKLINVSNATELQDAITTISGYTNKTGCIQITSDFTISSTITIPEGCNVTLVDDGTARTITRGADINMFEVGKTATLTFVSRGDVETPKLIFDGNSSVSATKEMILTAKDAGCTVNILSGVKVMNFTRSGAGAVMYLNANATTLLIDGAYFENNKSTSSAGGVMTISTGNTVEIKNSVFKGHEGTHGAVLETSSDLVISNCTFESNAATKNSNNFGGGVIYNWGNNVTITDSTFTENTSAKEGGSIYNGGGTLTLSGCTFSGNTASNSGGAIYNKGTLNITDSTFNGNIASYRGGAIYNTGGALTLLGTNADSAAFANNVASNWGGAIYTENGSLGIDGYTFSGNKGTYGGAILMFSETTVNNTTFQGNKATSGEGGAIYVNKNATFTDCYFDGNDATGNAGAVCVNAGGIVVDFVATTDENKKKMFTNNTTGKSGGAIYINNGTVKVYGYTFMNNGTYDIYVNTANITAKLEGDDQYEDNIE